MSIHNDKESSFDSFEPDEFINGLYNTILGRGSDEGGLRGWSARLSSGEIKPHQVVDKFLNSHERRTKELARYGSLAYERNPRFVGAPTTLSKSNESPKRIIMAGSCLFDYWSERFAKHCTIDRLTINNSPSLPEQPPNPPQTYDLQIVQLPLRAVLPEKSYMSLNYQRPEEYEKLFKECCARMAGMLEQSIVWNKKYGMLTFVCNFLAPQQNPLGRFAPRYDLRNLVYFIERLNEELYQQVSQSKNAHILDINQVSANAGRQNHQDDAIAVSVHHGLIDDFNIRRDKDRIEPVKSIKAQYVHHIAFFIDSVWNEVVAMYRTIKASDAIKLVIVDLDDTLWRGIAAENAYDTFGSAVSEGWPIGVVEALQHIKKRGILLAIASKNDEGIIRNLWAKMTAGRIAISDFAVVKINWLTKVENIKEILREVNLLPKNVLFIDDNPVERGSVAKALPGIRTLGQDPYVVRHTLLWAPELQGVTISQESSRRTEMVQSQVQRDAERETMSRDEFLKSLSLHVTITQISDTSHPRFARAFELLNKTNQFNTTGKRWSHEQVTALFQSRGKLQTFEVSDVYSDYGLVGVVVIDGSHIAQWAMSCRVLGLDVETAAARQIVLNMVAEGSKIVTAEVVPTEANIVCRDLFERCGFRSINGKWQLDTERLKWPTYPYVQVA